MTVRLFQVTLFLYVTATLGYFGLLWGKRRVFSRVASWLLFMGFVTHTCLILSRFWTGGHIPITNLHESFSFFSWCIVGFFIALMWKYRVEAIGIVVVPMASILMIAASFQDQRILAIPPILESYWLPIHGILCFTGEAVFTLAFAAGVLYLVQEARIKTKRPGDLSRWLPSLEMLDDINYKALSLGFPLLTAGIITGSFWADHAWGSYWSWDPKETWSLITWFIYAALLHQRINVGWRGRKAAIMAIIGFVCVAFTLVGVNLLSGLHSYASFSQ
jgi:cytochrome c-type biogenesis protein CcsB